MLAYLNGEYLDRARAAVSVEDRGFLFGDGVYEVTRAHDGRLFEAERHLRRLERGLAALQIARPRELESGSLIEISERLLRDDGLTSGDATVYLQITRGVAPRTHHFPPAGTSPTVYLSASSLAVPDDTRARGAAVILTTDLRWERCDLKTINLLPNIVGKQQAVAAGAFEAVFVRGDVVTEGASTNVFAVLDGELRTHPATHRILPGITRDVVLEIARESERELGVPVREVSLTSVELRRASEVFLTSTTNDVMPVTCIDGAVVGNGTPGPIARRLHAALVARMTGTAAAAR
jgi:D-alanine transaminase